MEFFATPQFDKRNKADFLILPFWQDKDKPSPAAPFGTKKVQPQLPIVLGDFKGKEGETCIHYVEKGLEHRILLLGLGSKESITMEKLRRAYSMAAKVALQKKLSILNVAIPHDTLLSNEEVVRGITEGILLVNYSFDELKRDSIKNEAPIRIKKVVFLGIEKDLLTISKKYAIIADSVYLARDLVNGNADTVSPQYLAEVAERLDKDFSSIRTTVFNKKRLENEGLGLILAVGRGSEGHTEPRLIIAEYKGNSKSKDHTVLVGKGISYDTGGLNMKPTGSMETMKCDMGGAAVVLATLQAVAALKLKCNVTAVVASAENAVSAKSFKPGDVYIGYANKSVEILNTDAEGRLVLADALAYSVKNLHPTRIIDVATLTGAIVIALGNEYIGLLSNNDDLADELLKSSQVTFERAHRMPLCDEYRESLKSSVADMKNVGGRNGGAILAAMFLQEFVGDIPWAHLDIAGTTFLDEVKRYHPKHATGIGVRLLTEFIEKSIK